MAFIKLCWGITLLTTCFAAFAFFTMMVDAKGAPQEASAAAIALCICIVPYVFTRSIEGLAMRKPMEGYASAGTAAPAPVLEPAEHDLPSA